MLNLGGGSGSPTAAAPPRPPTPPTPPRKGEDGGGAGAVSTTDDSAGLMEDQGLKELMDISGQLVEGIGEDTVLETMVRFRVRSFRVRSRGCRGGFQRLWESVCVCVFVELFTTTTQMWIVFSAAARRGRMKELCLYVYTYIPCV